MSKPIEFYFDFSSPYGYLAACEIDALAERHGREAAWRPYLMGAVMKLTGRRPLVDSEIVARYTANDLARTARRIGVPFSLPNPFPVATIAACRAYYWLAEQDAEKAKGLAMALYRAFFVDGKNIGEADVVLDVAEAAGVDRQVLAAALQDPAIKEKLKKITDDAAERGIFGSPFVIVDGEAFWGHDRFDQVDRWLASGGW